MKIHHYFVWDDFSLGIGIYKPNYAGYRLGLNLDLGFYCIFIYLFKED